MIRLFYLPILISLTLGSCNGQTNDTKNSKNIEKYQNKILAEEDLRETTDKAVSLILSKNYSEFKNLFADDIAKNISDQEIVQTVDHLNTVFNSQGVPSGRENILHALNGTVKDGDTVFTNTIMYKFKPVDDGNNPFQPVLKFTFIKKYGPDKLFKVNIENDYLSSRDIKPQIDHLEKFEFNASNISQFRIYYDEGEVKKTKFNNEVGYFAIQGEASILKDSGVLPIIRNIFQDLEKSEFEKVHTFNAPLDRDENAQFIQAGFLLRGKPYSIFIYLPLKSQGEYKDKIILRQQEFANLGYQFVLNQKDYPELVSEFSKIAKLDLNDYYLDKP